MSNQADEPLQKVTINLFKSDIDWFRKRYGNYQIALREIVRIHKRKQTEIDKAVRIVNSYEDNQ